EGLSCQCDGSGNCTLANISWVTSTLSIRKALSVTLWAGASSAFPRSSPIMNWPAGILTIWIPDLVVISLAESLLTTEAVLVSPSELEPLFSQAVRYKDATASSRNRIRFICAQPCVRPIILAPRLEPRGLFVAAAVGG